MNTIAFFLARGKSFDELKNATYVEKLFLMNTRDNYWKELAELFTTILYGGKE